MSPFVEFLKSALAAVPRPAAAHIARALLAQHAARVEGDTTNAIVHQGEVVGVQAIDQILAKIEASGE